jgi:ribosomal protein S18 acetylase RimI-like enzyme
VVDPGPPGAEDSAGPRLRPENSGDVAFLIELYGSTRAEELALTHWDAAGRAAFVNMQFSAQRHYYLTHFPDAQYDVVEWDGVRIGRVYVRRSADQITLMDIAFLPAYRNRGLGTRVMRTLIGESMTTGRPINLHVEINNAYAHRWYLRLGFAEVRTEGMHILMRRDPR